MKTEQQINDGLQRLSITDNVVGIIFKYMEAGLSELNAMKTGVLMLSELNDQLKIDLNNKATSFKEVLEVLKKYEKDVPKEIMEKIDSEIFDIVNNKIKKLEKKFKDFND